MVDSAARVPGCAWPVDAGACTPKGDRGSATSPFRRVRPCASGRVQTGAGVVESAISVLKRGKPTRGWTLGHQKIRRLTREGDVLVKVSPSGCPRCLTPTG